MKVYVVNRQTISIDSEHPSMASATERAVQLGGIAKVMTKPAVGGVKLDPNDPASWKPKRENGVRRPAPKPKGMNRPDYRYYIVLLVEDGRRGKYAIESGWEYKDDAVDRLNEVQHEIDFRGASRALAILTSKRVNGLYDAQRRELLKIDPNNDAHWMKGPYPPRKTYSDSQSRTERVPDRFADVGLLTGSFPRPGGEAHYEHNPTEGKTLLYIEWPALSFRVRRQDDKIMVSLDAGDTSRTYSVKNFDEVRNVYENLCDEHGSPSEVRTDKLMITGTLRNNPDMPKLRPEDVTVESLRDLVEEWRSLSRNPPEDRLTDDELAYFVDSLQWALSNLSEIPFTLLSVRVCAEDGGNWRESVMLDDGYVVATMAPPRRYGQGWLFDENHIAVDLRSLWRDRAKQERLAKALKRKGWISKPAYVLDTLTNNVVFMAPNSGGLVQNPGELLVVNDAGGHDSARAEKVYAMWHQKEPNRVQAIRPGCDEDDVMVRVGKAHNIVYRSGKWESGRKTNDYIHHFDSKPSVYMLAKKVGVEEVGSKTVGSLLSRARNRDGQFAVAELATPLSFGLDDGTDEGQDIKIHSGAKVYGAVDKKTVIIRDPKWGLIVIKGGQMYFDERGIVK